jgi:hypothetical protein
LAWLGNSDEEAAHQAPPADKRLSNTQARSPTRSYGQPEKIHDKKYRLRNRMVWSINHSSWYVVTVSNVTERSIARIAYRMACRYESRSPSTHNGDFYHGGGLLLLLG